MMDIWGITRCFRGLREHNWGAAAIRECTRRELIISKITAGDQTGTTARLWGDAWIVPEYCLSQVQQMLAWLKEEIRAVITI